MLCPGALQPQQGELYQMTGFYSLELQLADVHTHDLF